MFQGRQQWEWLDGGHPAARGPAPGAYGFYKLKEDGTALLLQTGTSLRNLQAGQIPLQPGMVMILPTVSKKGRLAVDSTQ